MNRLNINLPTPLYTRLRDEAKAQERTITVLVCRALEDYLTKPAVPVSVQSVAEPFRRFDEKD